MTTETPIEIPREFLGAWQLDDELTFFVTTHNGLGAVQEADASPLYQMRDAREVVFSGSMLSYGDRSGDRDGHYYRALQLTGPNGFERDTAYDIDITATVNGAPRVAHFRFEVQP